VDQLKKVKLTKGYFALVDNEDYARVIAAGKWYANDYHKVVYAEKGKTGTHKSLHRFILEVTNPRIKVDHRDNDGLNCQRHNLRVATTSQNAQNSRVHKDNSSPYKGVWFNKLNKNWRVRIRVLGRNVEVGSFSSAKKAAQAYDVAAKQHFGEFAKLNFPQEEQ
jgi:hypothetical protein